MANTQLPLSMTSLGLQKRPVLYGTIMRISSFFHLFFVIVPEMEPKFLHILGKFSVTQPHLQTFMDYKTDSHYVTQAILELKIPQLLNLLEFHDT